MEHFPKAVQAVLGPPMTDPEEEAFLVFSQAFPSQSLGFIDSPAATVQISIAGRDLTIHQSRGLLTSDRKEGTTGAVVWNVTPLFAEWVASPNFLADAGYISNSSIALELGTGVSGIVALTLAPKINKYIATDQDYVIRLLKRNIAENTPSTTAAKKTNTKNRRSQSARDRPHGSIETLELDWELDSVSALPSVLGFDGDRSGVDLIIACDCIYNDALIEPLNNTCAQICRLRPQDQGQKPTICVVAHQLRSPDVFESWLRSFHRSFHVWRVPDQYLTEPLRENTGFIVHIGVVR